MNKKLVKICMIGMPGSGKSTIGRALSDHLKFNFYDTDEQIELESQSRIKDIFINEGEDYFRKLERSIFKKLLLENIVYKFPELIVIFVSHNPNVFEYANVLLSLDK